MAAVAANATTDEFIRDCQIDRMMSSRCWIEAGGTLLPYRAEG